MTADRIDEAIARAAAATAVQRVEVTISTTGRVVALEVPPDITERELTELASWLLGPMLKAVQLEADQRAGLARPSARIIVPS